MEVYQSPVPRLSDAHREVSILSCRLPSLVSLAQPKSFSLFNPHVSSLPLQPSTVYRPFAVRSFPRTSGQDVAQQRCRSRTGLVTSCRQVKSKHQTLCSQTPTPVHPRATRLHVDKQPHTANAISLICHPPAILILLHQVISTSLILMSVDIRQACTSLRYPSRVETVSRSQLSKVHTGDSTRPAET